MYQLNNYCIKLTLRLLVKSRSDVLMGDHLYTYKPNGTIDSSGKDHWQKINQQPSNLIYDLVVAAVLKIVSQRQLGTTSNVPTSCVELLANIQLWQGGSSVRQTHCVVCSPEMTSTEDRLQLVLSMLNAMVAMHSYRYQTCALTVMLTWNARVITALLCAIISTCC